VQADVTTSLDAAADRIRAELGRPDLVVANAGLMLGAPFTTGTTSEWQDMVDTNVSGLLRTGRVFAADLLAAAGPADLVFVGSIASHSFFPGYAVYSATKAAVAALTRALRLELGPQGVRVRAVEPGLTATELGDTMLDPGARTALAGFRDALESIPASDVADAIAWSAGMPARTNVAELVVLPTAQG
jgi:NADP-dependent 3-hydroxy acid dehydrogenase YdfG